MYQQHNLLILLENVSNYLKRKLFLFLLTITCQLVVISELYDTHKDEDGFLYMTYSGENIFLVEII